MRRLNTAGKKGYSLLPVEITLSDVFGEILYKVQEKITRMCLI